MTNYEKLKKAVKGGKFKRLTIYSRLGRKLHDNYEYGDKIETLKCELMTAMDMDILDKTTQSLIFESAFDLLCEKLIADEVFKENEKKIESFDDFFEIMKEIIK